MMEPHGNQQQQLDDYKELFKVFGRTTFISEPRKYFIVFILFQFGMLIYFLITFKQSNEPLKIITIICYIIITLVQLIFPFTDPGIIPKIYAKKDKEEIPIDMNIFRQGREGLVYRQYSFVVKTHTFWSKYCGNCSIYRPPRAIHCYTCEICIEKLDHHCPWLGACIGKRNYYLYLLYICFMTFILALLCYQTAHFIAIRAFQDNQVQFVFNAILLALCIPSLIFVFILIILHIKLSKQNMTTNQLWHQKWNAPSGNPFQKTFFLKNCITIIRNVYRSKYDFQRKPLLKSPCKQQDETLNQIIVSHDKNKQIQLSQNPVTNGSESLQPFRGLEIILKLNDKSQE